MGLRPGARLAFGAVFVALGGALTVEMWDVGLVWGLSLFAMALGLVAMISGSLGIRHERCMRAEVERALAQWDELRRELEHARDTRQGVGKALTRLGYHDHRVRAWLRDR